MKKSKSILSITLALIMLISSLTIHASETSQLNSNSENIVQSSEAQANEVKSSEVQSSETKVNETQAGKIISSEVQTSETQTSEIQTSEIKTSETQTSEVQVQDTEVADQSKQNINETSAELLEEINRMSQDSKNDAKIAELKNKLLGEGSVDATGSSEQLIANEWLEVAMNTAGAFTIGTTEGNPNYTSDNGQKLLFGHPNPGTSETLISVNGEVRFFVADNYEIDQNNKILLAIMNFKGIQITERLQFYNNISTNRSDTVKISYSAVNTSGETAAVGIRIMMDTQLAEHDDAPFKIEGVGNVTYRKEFRGSTIPATYQVYDNLDSPSTLASGTLYVQNSIKPDIVQFTNWASIEGVSDFYQEVSENESIGDSAVVIYYNPQTLTSGTEMDVSTYYGTGIGIGSDSTEGVSDISSMSSRDTGIYVLNSTNGKPVSNATVALEGYPTTLVTDSSGKVIFRNIEKSMLGEKKATITHAEFNAGRPNERTLFIKSGYFNEIYIKQTNDKTPQVMSIVSSSSDNKYDKLNLLSKQIYLNENSSDIKEGTGNTEEITLSVTSDTDDCVYQIISDNQTIYENETGIFKITVFTKDNSGKTLTTDRIKDFKAGKKIYTRVISKDGYESRMTLLGLKVSSPSNSSTNILKNVDLIQGFDFGVSEDDETAINKLVTMFFGTKAPKMGKCASKIKVDFEPDGKVKVACGSDVSLLDTPDKWNKYKNVYESALETAKRSKSVYTNNTTKADSFGFGNLNMNLYVTGYGEGSVLKDGTIQVNVGIIMGVKGDISYTSQYFLGWLPVYITVGAKADASVTAEGSINIGDGINVYFSKGQFQPSFMLYLEGGVGASGAVSVGVQGKGKIEYLHDFPNNYDKVTLTAGVSLEVHALLYSNSLKIAEKTWNLYDSYTKTVNQTDSGISESVEGLYDINSYKLESRDYVDTVDAVGATETINSQVYVNACPKLLVSDDGTQYRLWIEDVCAYKSQYIRDQYNRTAIVCSVCKQGSDTWSKPVIIDDDGTADFAFDAEMSGNILNVVWQDANRCFTKEEAEDPAVGMEVMSASSEISFTTIDGSGTVINVGNETRLTDNKVSDMQPRITGNGINDLQVVWYSNSENKVIASSTDTETSTTTISTRNWNGNEWNATKVLDLGKYTITSFDVGVLQNEFKIAYVLDTDNNLNTSTDRELYLVDGINGEVNTSIIVKKETANVSDDLCPLFAKVNGTGALFWYQNNNYKYTTTTVENAVNVIAPEYVNSTVNAAYTVLQGASGTEVAWKGTSLNDDRYQSVYVADISSESSIPYELETINDYEDPVVSSISGFVNIEEGKKVEHICLMVTKYEENDNSTSTGNLVASEIRLYKPDDQTSLTFEDLTCDENKLIPGSNDSEMTVQLYNSGNTIINNAILNIDNVETELTDLNLKPGQRSSVGCSNVKIPNITGAVDVCVSIDENIKAKNTFSISLGQTDVSVEQQENEMLGDAEYLVFKIENNSITDASNVNFKLLANSIDEGTVMFDYTLKDKLCAGESYLVYCASDIFNTDVVYSHVTTSTQEAESSLYNNLGIVCLMARIPELISNNSFAIQSDSTDAGTIVQDNNYIYTDAYNTNDQIHIKATAKEGYVFDGWTSSGEGSFEDDQSEETIYTMGNKGTVVTAHFVTKNPLTGINLSDTKHSMEYGSTYMLEVVKIPSDASGFLTFSSDKTDIVSVDKNGNCKAIGIGTANITVMDKNNNMVNAICEISVTNVKCTALRIVNAAVVLNGNGTTKQMSVIKTPLNTTEAIQWSSSNSNIVDVNENSGLITAVSNGTAIITAKNSDGLITASSTVTVKNPLIGIALSVTRLQANVGEIKSIVVVPLPTYTSESLNQLTCKSSDESVAKVSVESSNPAHITISTIAGGHTTITAKIGNYTANCYVTVKVPITGITINPASLTLAKGEETALSCSRTPYSAEGTVEWSSSDAEIANVSDGIVSAVSIGTAIITATSDTGFSDTCIVNVIGNEIVVHSQQELQSSHPYEKNCNRIWKYTCQNATQIKFTFSDNSMFEPEYDSLTILDGNNKTIGIFSGEDLAGKTITVPGNTAKFHLISDSISEYYGFAVTAISPVIPEISASQGGQSSGISSGTTSVNPVIKTYIVTLNSYSTVLQVGKSTTALKAMIEEGDSISTWSSSDTKIATVSSQGKIKAKKAGTTVITVTTSQGAVAKCALSVQKKSVKLKGISVGKSKITLKKGDKYTIQVIKNPITYSEKVTYKTSNTKIASVNKSGVITAKKKGKCSITVKCGSKQKKIVTSVN